MRIISPTNMNASTKSGQKRMFCAYDQKTGYMVIRIRTPSMGVKDPVAKSNIAATAEPFANRSYLGCLVSTPRYSLTGAMMKIPAMNAAHKTCDCQIAPIRTSLPIPGISRLPIGIVVCHPPLRRPAGEVRDPDQREDHVDQHRQDHQEGYRGHEGSPEGAVSRLPVQPRDREEDDEDQGRYHDPPEAYERVTGEEHQHLVVEEEEPLGPGHVGRGADVRRLREGRGHHVRQEDDDPHKDGGYDEIRHDLPGEE